MRRTGVKKGEWQKKARVCEMKEKYADYISYGLLALAVIGLAFSFIGLLKNNQDSQPAIGAIKVNQNNNQGNGGGTAEPGFGAISSGSTGDGDVSVELTPIEVSENKVRVGIAANTHSVDLSQFDLKQITTMEYDGKMVNPVIAPVLTGHHSNGELVFDVNKKASSFVIRIKGIPKEEERIFRWQ